MSVHTSTPNATSSAPGLVQLTGGLSGSATSPSVAGVTLGGGSMTLSGGHAVTLTTGATTGVTLPSSGTLATLAGSESLSNKTIAGAAISGALTGTGAYIPVSLLNSGTSASSSTFWRGDGTWAAAGGTATAAVMSTDFSNPTRFELASAGSGSAIYLGSTSGLRMYTGTASGSYTNVQWYLDSNVSAKPYLGSPVFSAFVTLTYASGADNPTAYIGIGRITVDGTGHTWTDKHIGWKIKRESGGTYLYMTQANGTTELSVQLATLAINDALDLIIKVNGTSSVDYYYRINGGALSSAYNRTEYIPSSTNEAGMQMSISNTSTTGNLGIYSGGMSYTR